MGRVGLEARGAGGGAGPYSAGIFSGLGIPLSIATNNYGLLGVGPASGIAFGLSIGLAIEKKLKKENKIRPPAAEEKKRWRVAVLVGIILLVIGVVTFLLRLLV